MSDQAIRKFLQHPTGLRIEQSALENTDPVIVGDVSTGRFRFLVPQTFYEMVFQKFYSLPHGGAKESSKLIAERYVFFWYACLH